MVRHMKFLRPPSCLSFPFSQNGYGVSEDSKEAATWFYKAAKQKLAVAQYIIGVMKQTGINRRGIRLPNCTVFFRCTVFFLVSRRAYSDGGIPTNIPTSSHGRVWGGKGYGRRNGVVQESSRTGIRCRELVVRGNILPLGSLILFC